MVDFILKRTAGFRAANGKLLRGRPGYLLILEYQTSKSAGFTPSISVVGGSSTDYKWDLGDGTFAYTLSVSKNYPTTATKTVKLYCKGDCQISAFSSDSDSVVGTLNLSNVGFNTLTSLNIEYNSSLTSLIMPSQTGVFTYLNVRQAGLTGNLNLSSITNINNLTLELGTSTLQSWTFASSISGTLHRINTGYTNTIFNSSINLSAFSALSETATINLSAMANATGITFASSVSGTLSSFVINNVGFPTNTLNLTMFRRFTAQAGFSVQQLPGSKAWALPTTIETGTFSYLVMSGRMNATQNYSGYTMEGSNVYCILGGNNATSFSLPNPGTATFVNLDIVHNVSGVIDMSAFTSFVSGSTTWLNFQMYAATSIILGTITAKFYWFNIKFCYALQNLSIASLASDSFDVTNSTFSFYYDRSLTPAAVNKLLVEGNTKCNTGYSGRSFDISGNTMAIPDSTSGGYDGLAAKAAMEAKGITVTVRLV